MVVSKGVMAVSYMYKRGHSCFKKLMAVSKRSSRITPFFETAMTLLKQP
jgi:hypothetical protein